VKTDFKNYVPASGDILISEAGRRAQRIDQLLIETNYDPSGDIMISSDVLVDITELDPANKVEPVVDPVWKHRITHRYSLEDVKMQLEQANSYEISRSKGGAFLPGTEFREAKGDKLIITRAEDHTYVLYRTYTTPPPLWERLVVPIIALATIMALVGVAIVAKTDSNIVFYAMIIPAMATGFLLVTFGFPAMRPTMIWLEAEELKKRLACGELTQLSLS
jgi:hypothetical protein